MNHSKKTFLILIILLPLVSLPAIGQKKFRKVLFKNDSCYVYPYRKTDFGKYSYFSSNEDFMPYADSLPDGKYIVYGEETKYKRRGIIFFRKNIVKLDTTKVAIAFTAFKGKRNGPCWWYRQDGSLQSIGFYKNDNPDGIWISYNSWNGKLFEVQTYKDGLLNGSYVYYYDNGKVHENGSYINGKGTGEWKTYYANGNLEYVFTLYPDSMGTPPRDFVYSPVYSMSEINYNSICGKVYLYKKNGRLESVKDYLFGYRSVNDTIYYDDGDMEIKKFTGFSKDSVMQYTVEFISANGLPKSKYYYQSGSMFRSEYFENGELVKDEYYYYNYYNIDFAEAGDILPYSIEYKNGKKIKEIYIYKNQDYNDEIYFYRNPIEDGIINDFTYNYDSVSGEIYAEKHWYNKDSTYHYVEFISGDRKRGIKIDSSCIYTNGKLFSGKYVYFFRKRKNKLPAYKISDSTLVEIQYGKRWSFYRNTTVLSEKGSYLNGKENGLFVSYTKRHRIKEIKKYKNGLPDGENITYQMCWIKKNQKGKHYKKQWCESIHRTYKDGKLEGDYFVYEDDGTPGLIEHYKNDKLYGERLVYGYDDELEKNYLYKVSHYNNDSLDGKYEKYYSSGQVEESALYISGRLDGVCTEYNSDGTKYLQLNSSNGFLSGDNYEYYTNPANVIKITAHYDPKDSVAATIYSDVNKKENCLYTSYYKDGTTKAFEGNYGDALHGKTGIWNYWDENGKRIKQSDYMLGKFPNPLSGKANDSIYYLGKITECYSNGNKKTEGYILSETSNYDCKVEGYVVNEDIYYVNFWEENGTQVVKDKNGKLVSYYPDGKIKTQTTIKEGLKYGECKEWDPSGHLSKIGLYKNGLKEGRWLSGDLEGIGYVDSDCFTSEEEFDNAMRTSKEDVSITVTYYIKGVSYKQTTFYKNGRFYNYNEEW